jgi:uncharacterized membrane protein YeaQ/YmgE (transglycosylase-associated protein family)
MVLNIILWIIFGALAGWIASMIMHTNEEQGGMANIIVGIIGALIGGWLARALFGVTVSAFSISGLIIAILGAIILLAILRAFGVFGGRGAHHQI